MFALPISRSLSALRTSSTLAGLRRSGLVLALVLSVAGSSFAAPTPDSYVKERQEQLAKLLKDNGTAAQLHAVFDEMLDYDAIAKGSLAGSEGTAKPEERKEFDKLLRDLVRRAYVKNLKKTLGFEVRFTGVTDARGGKLVSTVAQNKAKKREDPIEIGYLLVERGGRWWMTDLITEGESLVANYRRQFGGVIKRQGFAGLLERMRAKLAKE